MATLTLNENIDRIENAKASIKTAIEAKGVVVPAEIKLDGYAAKIDEIQGGTIDITGTGWETEKEFPVCVARQDQLNEDIAYTKQKFAEWDPSRTSASMEYRGDTQMVYAPLIDTSAVTDMCYMFMDCTNLVAVPNLNMEKATNIERMFVRCSKLESIPVLDLSKVDNAILLFDTCNSLHRIEMKGGIKEGCDCDGMFYGVTSTGTLYLHVGNGITRESYQPVITRLPPTWTVEYITDELVEVEAKKTVEITSNGTTEIVPAPGYQGIAGATVNVNVPSGGGGASFDWEGTGWTPEEGKAVDAEDVKRKEADIAYTRQKFNEWNPSSSTTQSLYFRDQKIVYAPAIDTSMVTIMNQMFDGCEALTDVPLFDTSKVGYMPWMFQGCRKLTSVPLFDTSAVTDMMQMFDGCNALTSVPLFNTSKVTDMNGMFSDCKALTTIPALDTSSATDMGKMFEYCESLTSVPAFDTSSVINMNCMFRNCVNLATIPTLDTSKVTSMASMFYWCNRLYNVPLMDTSKVEDMTDMFNDCRILSSIEFKGGVAPGCKCTRMFYKVSPKGVLKLHVGNGITRESYQPVIDALPSTWTVEEIEDPAPAA